MTPGSYALVLKLDSGRELLTRGRRFMLRKGYYVYVGSALSGLEARIGRHLRKEKRKFWHIDYLLEHAGVVEVLRFPGGKECGIARDVEEASDGSVKGFGCSDCRCSSHLFYFRRFPEIWKA